jgi:hypothetical protein
MSTRSWWRRTLRSGGILEYLTRLRSREDLARLRSTVRDDPAHLALGWRTTDRTLRRRTSGVGHGALTWVTTIVERRLRAVGRRWRTERGLRNGARKPIDFAMGHGILDPMHVWSRSRRLAVIWRGSRAVRSLSLYRKGTGDSSLVRREVVVEALRGCRSRWEPSRRMRVLLMLVRKVRRGTTASASCPGRRSLSLEVVRLSLAHLAVDLRVLHAVLRGSHSHLVVSGHSTPLWLAETRLLLPLRRRRLEHRIARRRCARRLGFGGLGRRTLRDESFCRFRLLLLFFLRRGIRLFLLGDIAANHAEVPEHEVGNEHLLVERSAGIGELDVREAVDGALDVDGVSGKVGETRRSR